MPPALYADMARNREAWGTMISKRTRDVPSMPTILRGFSQPSFGADTPRAPLFEGSALLVPWLVHVPKKQWICTYNNSTLQSLCASFIIK